MGAPLDVVSARIQMRYTPDWKPLELSLDAALRGQTLVSRTTVANGTAQSELTQGGQSRQLNDAVAADALFLPSPFWRRSKRSRRG